MEARCLCQPLEGNLSQICKFCPKTFTKKFNLRRHTIKMHKINDGLLVCIFFGKSMLRKDHLKIYEKKCNGQTLGKHVNKEKRLECVVS